MRFYSDELKKFFKTEDECLKAEQKFLREQAAKEVEEKRKAEERGNRAKEVEEAYKAFCDAKKTYTSKLNAFCKDYGSYHMTIKGLEADPLQLFANFFEF